MLERFVHGAVLSGLLAFGGFAQATLIDNGNSTIDTATGFEWLDLTLTTGQSYDSIVGGFGGYAAQGYVHATTSQLCGLFGSLGDAISGCVSATNDVRNPLSQSTASTLTSLLGVTLTIGAQPTSAGIFDSGMLPASIGLGCVDAGTTTVTACGSGTRPSASRLLSWVAPGASHVAAGNWLVRRATVPEPTSLLLLGLGLAGLGLARRCR